MYNRKPDPITSVSIDHVVPRIFELHISIFGFVYSISLDEIDKSVYRVIDVSNGMVMNTFTSYNQCMNYISENEFELIDSAIDNDF